MHAGDQSQPTALLLEFGHFAIMHTYAGSVQFVQFRPALSTFGQWLPDTAFTALAEERPHHLVFGTTVARPGSGTVPSFGGAMATFLQDVRFAFRQFASHPGFALT